MRAILVCLLLLVCEATSARAQFVTTLMEFTDLWRYNQSGADLGTNWRSFDYTDDATWDGPGEGLLGIDNNDPLVFPTHMTPLVLSNSIVTYYFRGGFNFFGSVQGLSLIASNYIDDGAVIYLNGTEVGRFRVPTNQTFETRSPSGPEGNLETLSITNLSLLRQGTNVIAVELHQSAAPALDLTWGMKLMLFRATPLTFSAQPQSQSAFLGDNVLLDAAVTGGPAFYQWQKNGTNLPGATNGSTVIGVPSSSLTISNAPLSSSGQYRVIATNALGAITSEVAVVTIYDDRMGPKLVSAIIDNPLLLTTIPNRKNTINLRFDSPVTSTTGPQGVRNVTNYRLVRMGEPEVEISISNILYNISLGAILWPYETNAAWSSNGNYYLVVNNVADTRTNVIAPNSRIVVQQPVHTNLISANASWSFHTSAVPDPGVYEENWQSLNYTEGFWWNHGQGPFAGGTLVPPSCLGTFRTTTSFQREPSLFRYRFWWPTNWPTSALLRLGVMADDTAIVFLNGMEIWRTNVTGDVSPMLRAGFTTDVCQTNIILSVENLLPGTNQLAAALVQSDGQSVQSFGLELGGIVFSAPSLAAEPEPSLTAALLNTNTVRLSWTGGGFALESSTNLKAGWASYPQGPWQEVRKMSNPYTNSWEATPQFFRLKK